MKYFNHWGYICPNGFDDNDASVICRDINPLYAGGIAYVLSEQNELRWLSNINCSGNEAYFSKCRPLKFGDISNCTTSQIVGSYCYSDAGKSFASASIQL